MTTKLRFTTSHSMFYLVDKNHSPMEHLFSYSFVSNIDSRLLNLNDFAIAIITSSYTHIKGELKILEKPNNAYNPDLYDHIVESCINVESGVIKLLDAPDALFILEKRIPPGRYRIRVYSSNLDSVIDEDAKSKDYYKIEMWLDNNLDRKVLKWYHRNID
jgi:hypothetical protein